jgi:hypothetical protein
MKRTLYILILIGAVTCLFVYVRFSSSPFSEGVAEATIPEVEASEPVMTREVFVVEEGRHLRVSYGADGVLVRADAGSPRCRGRYI